MAKPKNPLGRQSKQLLARFASSVALILYSILPTALLLPGRAHAFAGVGNGSLESPYRITNCDQLQSISDNLSAAYVLMNDIDCSAKTDWEPIGVFTGFFDGRNHTISNLSYSTFTNTGVLFTSLDHAALKNLKLTNATMGGGGTNVGILAGQEFDSQISNVAVSGAISGSSCIGGLVGVMSGGGIANSSFSGSVTVSGDWTGGLVGVQINALITDSWANATITGNSHGSGIITGKLEATSGSNSQINNVYALGDENVSNFRGALVGDVDATGGATISISNAFVVANAHGGSAAYSHATNGSASVSNIYFDGTVLGYNDRCVNGGMVSGCNVVNGDGTDPDHFKGTSSVDPISGWDFSDVWQISAGNYPQLKERTPDTLTDPVLPGAPSSLTATQGTPKNSINVNWTAANDGGSDVKYTVLYRDVTAGETSFTYYHTNSANTTIIFGSMPLHHQFEFKVYATNVVGDGPMSAAATVTTDSNNVESITTCQQLQDINDNLNGSYVLANDIDCTGSASWNGGEGFEPIGIHNYLNGFVGSLDGQDHTISGLVEDRSEDNDISNVGLFFTTTNATISNIKIMSSSFTGIGPSGSFAATAYGTHFSRVYSTADVNGSSGNYVGGLVGELNSFSGDPRDSTIDQSAYRGTVTGGAYVGGLVGYARYATITDSDAHTLVVLYSASTGAGGLAGKLADSVVSNSYAIGTVQTTLESFSLGGLIGLAINSNVSNTFTVVAIEAGSPDSGGLIGNILGSVPVTNSAYDQYTSTVSGCVDNADYTGCTAVNTDGNDGSHFKGNSHVAPLSSWDFPNVWHQYTAGYPMQTWLTGIPTHTVSSCADLANIENDLTATYVLDRDISCFGYSDFPRIGVNEGEDPGGFSGVLNGNGHTIYGLNEDYSYGGFVGLFSYMIDGGTVENLSLKSATAHAGANGGLLAGALYDDSKLINVSADSDSVITCESDSCGGLAGHLFDNSSIMHSYASATVNGLGNYTGGLVGMAEGDEVYPVTMFNNYFNGTVNGADYTGGLVGLGASINLADSYAAGHVSGGNIVGGILGLYDGGNLAGTVAVDSISTTGQAGPTNGIYGSGGVGNRYFDTNITGFVWSPDGSTGISDSDYFRGNHSHEPISQWNFDSLWATKVGNYPVFQSAPDNVTSVTAQPNLHTLTIHWEAPTNINHPDITSYSVKYRVADTDDEWTYLDDIPADADLSATLTGLTPLTAYNIAIITHNDYGSGGGTGIIAYTLPTPPVTITTSGTPTASIKDAADSNIADSILADAGLTTTEPFSAATGASNGGSSNNGQTDTHPAFKLADLFKWPLGGIWIIAISSLGVIYVRFRRLP